jgi:arylsulfatase A-like enzyme
MYRPVKRINVSVVIASAILAMTSPVALHARDQGPNILFIMSDDHASEAIGAYGSWLKKYCPTPTIDRLAAEGMRFTNVCCNNSICSPSRASILTGQYSHKNGVPNLNGAINGDSPQVAAELQKTGYQTAVFGKWHLSSRPKGFDTFKVTRGQGAWFDPVFFSKDNQWYGKKKKREVVPGEKHTGYSSDVYTTEALKWLKARDAGKPFCMMLHFKAPHHSYEYPERWKDYLKDTLIPEPPSLHEKVAKSSPLLKGVHTWHMLEKNGYFGRHDQDKEPPMWPHDGSARGKTSAAYQHMIHKYLRSVGAVDDNIKRVVDYLEEQGIKDDTLIIYTSDQGYWLGQHGLYDKRLILEESLKMPFIVRYPKEIKAGSVNEALCSNVDFAPTLLDIAGIAIPKAMQGVSLRPLLQGKKPANWRKGIWYAYWATGHFHWGVRTTRHKLIRFPSTTDYEFYDLKKDPFEMHNLAGNQDYQEAIAGTGQLLENLIKQVDIKPEQMPGAKNQ